MIYAGWYVELLSLYSTEQLPPNVEIMILSELMELYSKLFK